MAEQPTRILIVDDSALYRQTIHNVLRGMPHVAVVGTARDGSDAIRKIEALDPDLLTLDVQMPDMDGIGVLREIKRRGLRSKAIMVSSFTADGAQVTTDALLCGAFDFILKPTQGDSSTNRKELFDSLEHKIAAFRQRGPALGEAPPGRARQVDQASAGGLADRAPAATRECRAVLFGASTGGPVAFKLILPHLPEDLGVPVLVVQHMPPHYTRSLAERLNGLCALEVREAADGMSVEAGQVLIAPGGKQMKVERKSAGRRIRITDDPPENGCRPSVDYLFRYAADAYDGAVLGVVLTGMGRDGCLGSETIRNAGGYVFAQQREGCTVYGMPKAVIKAELADRILPLGKVAAAVSRHVKRSRHA